MNYGANRYFIPVTCFTGDGTQNHSLLVDVVNMWLSILAFMIFFCGDMGKYQHNN